MNKDNTLYSKYLNIVNNWELDELSINLEMF